MTSHLMKLKQAINSMRPPQDSSDQCNPQLLKGCDCKVVNGSMRDNPMKRHQRGTSLYKDWIISCSIVNPHQYRMQKLKQERRIANQVKGNNGQTSTMYPFTPLSTRWMYSKMTAKFIPKNIVPMKMAHMVIQTCLIFLYLRSKPRFSQRRVSSGTQLTFTSYPSRFILYPSLCNSSTISFWHEYLNWTIQNLLCFLGSLCFSAMTFFNRLLFLVKKSTSYFYSFGVVARNSFRSSSIERRFWISRKSLRIQISLTGKLSLKMGLINAQSLCKILHIYSSITLNTSPFAKSLTGILKSRLKSDSFNFGLISYRLQIKAFIFYLSTFSISFCYIKMCLDRVRLLALHLSRQNMIHHETTAAILIQDWTSTMKVVRFYQNPIADKGLPLLRSQYRRYRLGIVQKKVIEIQRIVCIAMKNMQNLTPIPRMSRYSVGLMKERDFLLSGFSQQGQSLKLSESMIPGNEALP